MIKAIIKYIAILIIGALGAFLFEFFVFPYMLADPSFESFQFVKNFKEGKIIVNQTQQVYIQENTALENAVKNSEKSIVSIQKNGVIVGSGLIATSDGSVITLASLVPAGSKISIFLNGEALTFQIIKRDIKNNLALIKVGKNNLPTVGFADFDKLLLGQRVFLSGAGFANEGIIRSFDNSILKTNISEKYIALGTPLFNISGELVGLNYIDQDGKVSAISVNTIK
ncbi:MAG: S1C family serine protease, partial [Patescibacteria group bacterium]